MSKPLLSALLITLVPLVSCTDPYDDYAPAPRFRPNPPYAPREVTPEARTTSPDPYPELAPAPAPAPRPLAPTPPAAGGYPTATRTANPNEVLSPYEPFNVIDVEGFQSGKLVRDPSNKKIFRVP